MQRRMKNEDPLIPLIRLGIKCTSLRNETITFDIPINPTMLKALILLCLFSLAKANKHDLECYDEVFGANNSTRKVLPESIRVTVRQWHETDHDRDLQNEDVYILKSDGIKNEFKYTYTNPGFGFTSKNPRYLTMTFDGINVRAAMRLLKESYFSFSLEHESEWAECQSFQGGAGGGTTLKYHQYTHVRDTTISGWSEELEIDVEAVGTPQGPYYDDECLDILPDPKVAEEDINPTDEVMVTVTDIYQLRDYGSSYYEINKVRSEVNITLTSEDPTVKLQYNQTVASGGYGFHGDEVQPRNLTLTLDPKTGAVIATMAELDQSHSYRYNHWENTEEWLCKKVALVKNETNEFSYVTMADTSSLSSIYIYEHDILSVKRSSSTALAATSISLLGLGALMKVFS